jgi:hypothetical protein
MTAVADFDPALSRLLADLNASASALDVERFLGHFVRGQQRPRLSEAWIELHLRLRHEPCARSLPFLLPDLPSSLPIQGRGCA